MNSDEKFGNRLFPGLALALSMGCTISTAQDTTRQPEPAPNPDEETWYDSGHSAATGSADELAQWVDSFFGLPQADLESATSIIRLRPQYQYDEEDGSDWKLRATGQLRLPRLNQRLSLVFIGQDGEFGEEFYDPARSDGDSSVALQYQIRDDEHHRLDLLVGGKSGPKGKVGMRYRYQVPFMQRNRFRFSEELSWVGGDGFGTLSRFDIDHLLSQRTLLRWANRGEYSEESNGLEWSSRVAWVKRLDKRRAASVFTFIRGDTDPDLLKSYGVGLSFRRRYLRDWLFLELEPRYAWRKGKQDEERDGVYSVRLRLEIIIGSGRKK